MKTSSCRVVAHIDMDCFYVQVERSLNRDLLGVPVVVVQYNPFGDLKSISDCKERLIDSNGSIIAVSYEARARGVKRTMRGLEAKRVCPELILVQVPTAHGKADLTIYREAGAKVVQVLKKLNCTTEKASIDEVYLDITSAVQSRLDSLRSEDIKEIVSTRRNSLIAGQNEEELKLSRRAISRGHDGTIYKESESDLYLKRNSCLDKPFDFWSMTDKFLACGAVIVQELRELVWKELGFTCSGGIAHNRMLAKIASAMHKPNKQTIVPMDIVDHLMTNIPVSRVQGFGGKLGHELVNLPVPIHTFGDLRVMDRNILVSVFGEETTSRILNTAVGIDHEPVKERSLIQSIGCGKSYTSTKALTASSLRDGTIKHWIEEFSEDMHFRIMTDTDMNSRRPKLLTVHLTMRIPINGTSNQVTVSSQQTTSVSGKSESELENKDVVENPVDASSSSSTLSSPPKSHPHQPSLSGETRRMALSKAGMMPVSCSATAISTLAYALVLRIISESTNHKDGWKISSISMGASNFESIASGDSAISKYFGKTTDGARHSASNDAGDLTTSSNANKGGVENRFSPAKSSALPGAPRHSNILTDCWKKQQEQQQQQQQQQQSSPREQKLGSIVEPICPEDIDAAVFSELPREIQEEIRSAYKFSKFGSKPAVKRKATIESFMCPSKKQ